MPLAQNPQVDSQNPDDEVCSSTLTLTTKLIYHGRINHVSLPTGVYSSTFNSSGEYCTLILIISLQLIFKAKGRYTERCCLRSTSAGEPWQPLIFSNVKNCRCPRCGNHYHGDNTSWPACQQCGTRHNTTLPACPLAKNVGTASRGRWWQPNILTLLFLQLRSATASGDILATLQSIFLESIPDQMQRHSCNQCIYRWMQK